MRLWILPVMSYFGAVWCLSDVVTKSIIHPKVLTKKQLMEREISRKRFPVEFYKSVETTRYTVQSPWGYELHCMRLNNKETKETNQQKKVCIFCHGFKQAGLGMLGYAKIVMKAGYTAILYDQRNHGKTKRLNSSMGHYEKDDLKAVIDDCIKKYGKDTKIITYGESMGAATVLMNLSNDSRVFLAIADCPYADLNELVAHLVKRKIHVSGVLLRKIAQAKIRRYAGFDTKEVTPRLGAIRSKTPILFIHGTKDYYVPTAMSIDMYNQRAKAKELYLCKGAGHAASLVTRPKEYEDRVLSFIKKYESKSGLLEDGNTI